MSDTISSVFVNSDWLPKSLYLLLIRKLENIINTDEILFHYCLTFKLFFKYGHLRCPICSTFGVGRVGTSRGVERHIWKDTFWGFWSKKDKLHYVWKDTFQNIVDKKISTNSQFLPSKLSVNILHGEAFIDKLGP